jgi:alpha-L-arabinofuranosidase
MKISPCGLPEPRRLRPRRRVRVIAMISCLGLITSGAVSLLAPAAATAATTLAAHWTFDEGSGTTAADSSGNGHTGTLGATAAWAAGEIGPHSVAFNGTATSNVAVAGPVVDTSQSFTVSAWVKLNATSGFQTVVSIDGTNISGFFLQLRADTGTFAFTRLASDSVSAATTVSGASLAPSAGTWYHIVGVQDTTAGTIQLFVNGQPQPAQGYTTPWQAAGGTMIGRGKYNGNPVDFVNGNVDDVRMWSGALTASEIAGLDQAAHWTFDEGTGTTAHDVSGHGHDGTLGSGASWAPGTVGPHSVALNGTAAGNVTVPGPVVDTSGSFSVSAWVNVTSLKGRQTAVSIDGNQVSGFSLELNGATGRFALARPVSDTPGAAVIASAAGSAAQAGRWYQLIGVYDAAAGELALYVNGIPQAAAAFTTPWQATGNTLIGRGLAGGNPAAFLHGRVDDVQMFGYALSGAQVQALSGVAAGTLDVNAGSPSHGISPTLFGLMTEDINHSGEGGLYGELIQNRSMMASTSSPTAWSLVTSGAGSGSMSLDPGTPLNSALTQSLELQISHAASGARVGVANSGFFGIPVRPRQAYTASFFAKATAGFTGPLTVDVESTGGQVFASGTVKGLTAAWKQYTVHMVAGASAPTTADTQFVISTRKGPGATVWFDNVSLFPPTYHSTPNGNRIDLMQKLVALHPSFLRLPGGNYLEGNTIATRFNWKTTIGPVWTRPGHQDDAWGYWSTDGLGLLEYLEWCQDMGAQPVLAVYAGYSLNGTHVPPGPALAPYVQDALDEIQYVTGSTSTPWGAQRAADGHPAPFTLNYVEVGNEDQFDRSGSYSGRFAQFNDAIKAAYPALKVIATTPVTGSTPDVIDEHFYRSPAFFDANSHMFDNAQRTGPKIFVGEWASQEGRPTPDLNAALGDASWLTGLERNSDQVIMSSYAPLLANVNSFQWPTNLIGFDTLTSFGSPSYYVHQMMFNNHGDAVLPATYSGTGAVNVVSSVDSATGKVYLTVVNYTGTPQHVQVNITGATNISGHATATVLRGNSPTATNTITNPTAVVPSTSTVSGLGPSFKRIFPPYSVTVLTLGT